MRVYIQCEAKCATEQVKRQSGLFIRSLCIQIIRVCTFIIHPRHTGVAARPQYLDTAADEPHLPSSTRRRDNALFLCKARTWCTQLVRTHTHYNSIIIYYKPFVLFVRAHTYYIYNNNNISYTYMQHYVILHNEIHPSYYNTRDGSNNI